MDAPPIPCLVDLVHAFNGVVVEQFKKGAENLLSDSILLWKLLKLLFKILLDVLLIFSLTLIYAVAGGLEIYSFNPSQQHKHKRSASSFY